MDPLVNNKSNNQIPINGQRFRPGMGQTRASGYGTGAQAPAFSSATGLPAAQPIEPMPGASSALPPLPPAPSSDFTPDLNEKDDIVLADPPAKKSPNKLLLGILGVLIVVAAFVGGMFVGKMILGDNNQLACETSGTLPAPSDTPAPSSNPSVLSAAETAELSEKVSYLLMGASADVPASSEYLTLGAPSGFRKLTSLTNNALTDAEKLDIAIYSLSSEYEPVETEDGVAKSAVAVESVKARYLEIFGTELVESASAVCEGWHVLTEDSTQYVIGSCPETHIMSADLVLKENFALDENGDAVATVIVGSSINDANEYDTEPADAIPNGIYNDFADSAQKTIVTPKTDFASEEEFSAFTITPENASQFTAYQFIFEETDSGFVFREVKKA
ncbi:MAG: hypothetical protein Q4F60_02215 [Candidatus Saccharibacteria bacterium]|nr:hypothetical protein [Candidatus Saccharibacteria bacterium]